MSHHYQQPPSSYPTQPHQSMSMTHAAYPGSGSNSGNMSYYPQQQYPMMYQQQIHHQQQYSQQQMHPQQQQQQQSFPSKPTNSTIEPPSEINIGLQCDFCGGDEQENKTTKLAEKMITCKVFSSYFYSIDSICLFRIVVVLLIQRALNLRLVWFTKSKLMHGNVWNVKLVLNVVVRKMILNFYFAMTVIGKSNYISFHFLIDFL